MSLSQSNIIAKIDLGHTVFIKKANGIVEAQCSDNFTYEIEHIKENLECLKSLAENGRLLMLNCLEPYTQLSAEARFFIAKGSHINIIKAEAFVIQSFAQKLIANFFIKVDKPKVPMNFFLKKEEAEKWLLKFNEKLTQ
jgi:hypothetical protein